MLAKDYRHKAIDSLTGKWGLAVGTTLVATILGGVGSSSGGGAGSAATNMPTEDIDYQGNFGYIVNSVESTLDAPEVVEKVLPIILAFAFITAVLSLVGFILGGATKTGLCKFNQNLYYKTEPRFKDLFFHYNNFGKLFIANLLTTIFVFLWSLLFVIPGIIAAYSYSMVFYILDENPEMSAMDAIRASKQMMKGHKWELFCLHISFIGWAFLSVFTLGIGYLFLSPYMIAADCAFYNEVKLLNAGESGYAAPPMANAYEPVVHEAEADSEPEVVDIPTDEQEVVSEDEEEEA